ncbi:hypothetical protein PAMA_003621 [Pampus argenteus]
METSVDRWNNRVSYTQSNPLFDMSVSGSDLYSVQPDDLKPVRPRRQWCFNVIVVYLVLQTALNVFLLYKVFMLELPSNLSSETLMLSNHIGMGEEQDDGKLQTFIHNNTEETKILRGQLWTLQSQVDSLCGEDGQLDRMRADLNLLNMSTNNLGDKLTAVSLQPGPPGPPGTTGKPGVPGERGLKGDSGLIGPPGPKGDMGLKGQSGEPGVAGSPGPTGPPGRTGLRGLPGAPGNQGEGVKGERGEPGAKGTDGIKGATGSPGQIGAAGIPGLKGDKGDLGNNGPPGPPGVRGPEGSTGAPGPSGAKGSKGEKGSARDEIVRLIPGPSRGRVEVKHNGVWGTVCDDNFNSADGVVICKMLGYQRATSVFTAEAGTGSIWLDDLQCTGSESNVFNCSHNGVGVNNCGHSEDAGVQCA